MKDVKRLLSFAVLLGNPAWAAVRPEANAAFDQYVESQAQQRARQGSGCDLWIECSPTLKQRVMAGEIIVKPITALLPATKLRVPGGEINDTTGAMFLKGETIARLRTVLGDYARFPEIYGPDIIEAKVQSKEGQDPEVFIRVRKHFVITVVLDILCRVHSSAPDAAHAFEHTTAIRIREVKDPNRPDDGERTAEEDRGFLWRYESYWRMEETEQGVLVEHQMISLSRKTPPSLQFVLRPILSKLPRESMYRSLVATRQGLPERCPRKPKLDRDSNQTQTLPIAQAQPQVHAKMPLR